MGASSARNARAEGWIFMRDSCARSLSRLVPELWIQTRPSDTTFAPMSSHAKLGPAEALPNGKATYASGNGLALVTLVNPPANGYSYAMMRDLDEAILRARFDEAVQVI